MRICKSKTFGNEKVPDEIINLALSPEGGYACADFSPYKLIVRVRHAEYDTYDVLYESRIHSAFAHYTYKEGQRLPDITAYVESMCEGLQADGAQDLLYPNAITIKKHPLYIAAMESGNEYLSADIAVHYGIGRAKDYELLHSCDGLYRLPELPDEYDIKYCVKRSTIDTELLGRSGYRICRMSRMGMKGKTHDS